MTDVDSAMPREVAGKRVAWIAVGVGLGLVVALGLLTQLPFWDSIVGTGTGAYATIVALIIGDAIIPVLPGETTLNVAAVAASDGNLSLSWVIAAGALGAVIGDSCVYWIARSLRGPLHERLMRAANHDRAQAFLKVFANRAPMMIVFGRYVPGLRLAINVTMGSVVRLPYPRFLMWSAIAGTLWSIYTCSLAYAVATVLESSPLAAIIISGLITSAALVVIGWTLHRDLKATKTV